MSLGDTAPVVGFGVTGGPGATAARSIRETGNVTSTAYAGTWSNAGETYLMAEDPNNTGYPNILTDLSAAVGPAVNEMREAVQVQRLLEKDARSGTRLISIIKSHFGVNSPDSRMQRPEYLGGGSTPVIVSPVARTDSSPGVLGAQGVAAFKGHGFVKSFTEHCIIIGLVNVRADLTYQEGLDKMWSRQTRFDFYWPTLAHLGEQAILNKEIYIDATTIGSGASEDVFGYQERFAEYRYKPSKITGKFRSNVYVYFCWCWWICFSCC